MRSGFEAWNAGDIDAVRRVYDADVIMRYPEGWPESGPFVGLKAVLGQWEQNRKAFDANALEPIGDFVDVADRVAGRFIWLGVGHGPD